MWEQMTADIREQGGEVRLNAPVTKLKVADGRITEVVAGGETLYPSHVISSLPLRTTVGITEPRRRWRYATRPAACATGSS